MFLDTSIIIEIFRSGKSSKQFEEIYYQIKDEPLFISIIQVGEISDWCLKNDIDPVKRILKLKHILNTIPLSETICLEGSQIKHDMRNREISKFSLMDGIILASARSINQKLLSTDNDFRKTSDVIIL
ncbi:MAG: PIN domain-containing protein [Methanosarcinales archaeon]|nr:PIN domain-containing protein [Methanosarcinales archaeon]